MSVVILDFKRCGDDYRASAPTIWLDATPFGPSMPPPASSPQFYARFPSCRNPLNLSRLAQVTNTLDCIPGGLVSLLTLT